MKEFDFKQLSLDRKCRYVLNHCTFIASRRTLTTERRICRINLYHNSGRFYEIWYNSEHDYIGDVKRCTGNDVLDAYADQIDIEKIALL